MASAEQSDLRLTRRRLLIAGGTSAAALAASGVFAWVEGGNDAVETADFVLHASRGEIELGRRRVETMVYDGRLPGREIRLRQGRPARIRVINDLDVPTTIHWHGIRLDNRADGVPGLTQEPVAPGDTFDYVFTPPDAGTYLYHSHFGTQLDRGLYGALIVEPRREELDYDREAVLLLDDWLDGVDGEPDQVLRRLRRAGMDMPGMDGMNGMNGMNGMDGMAGSGTMAMGAASAADALRGPHRRLDGGRPDADHLAGLANAMQSGKVDPGDVRHPLYLVNGRPPEDPVRIDVRRGDRVRLRIANPSADTIFRVFIEDHEISVTHADGLPVRPVTADGIVVGMGERYDVLLDARAAGVSRIVAEPLGKTGRALALLRYAGARAQTVRPEDPVRAPRRLASYQDLQSPERPEPEPRARAIALPLGLRSPYSWTLGGQAFPDADDVQIHRGETVRFRMTNHTNMPHPMHLHGHSFRPVIRDGVAGPLKDTILVPPHRTTAIEWLADNPGAWAFHCHNAYHAEAGMMRRVDVA